MSKKKPAKAEKMRPAPVMREGQPATDAFTKAMRQILNPLPTKKL